MDVLNIRNHLEEMTKKMVKNAVLESAEKGLLTRDQWQKFGKQRYIASSLFETFLETCIKKAVKVGDKELAEVLERNLRDEQGVDEKRLPLAVGSHEEWRKNFYHALGLDEEDISRAKPLEGTNQYDQTLRRLICEGDLETMVGALLLLEYSIPWEFKRLQKGRDLTFPEKFIIMPEDNHETRQQKGRARLYIDHHIVHDADSHYPDLERTLKKYFRHPESKRKIIAGMKMICAAKQKLYKSLEQELFTTSKA